MAKKTTFSNDKLFEATIVKQLRLLRIDAQFKKEIFSDLKSLEESIIAKLANSDLTDIRIKELNVLLKSVNKLIAEQYDVINERMKNNLTELAKIEATGITKLLVGVDIALKAVTPAKLNKLYDDRLIEGAPSAEWWSRQSLSLQNKFIDTIRKGIIANESNGDLIRRVRGTKKLGFTDGIMETTRAQAEALIRSSVQAVANDARMAVFDANEDIIRSYRYVATLDSRTTTMCAVRDGLRWNVRKEPINHDMSFQQPPIHWGCRSTIVAEIKGFDLPDTAERASVDGPVKASTTFEDFLDKKIKTEPEFINELLGPGRAELYKSGKITFRQLLDQSGNPLTLKQLSKIYGI